MSFYQSSLGHNLKSLVSMITTVNGKQKRNDYDTTGQYTQWAATAAVAFCHQIQI